MKITKKKLTRGLPDLSVLFSSEPKANLKERPAVKILPPQNSGVRTLVPRLVCAAFHPCGPDEMDVNLKELMDAMKQTFDRMFLLCVSPSRSRYEYLSHMLPIPPWEAVSQNQGVSFQPLTDYATFGLMPAKHFESVIHPKGASVPAGQDTSRKALALIDWSTIADLKSRAITLLDHCVVVLPAELDRIIETYELLRSFYVHNPALRCSIFLVGSDANKLWEFVYERLCEIVSRFLGRDLGFLGYDDHGCFRLNPDLLLEESTSSAQLSSKIRLGETLFSCN